MTKPIRTLRERLRAETRDSHARLDEALSGADIASRDGLIHFLKVQGGGFAALRESQASLAVSQMIADLADRAERDLIALAEQPIRPGHSIPSFDPLAVAYVSAGSRLGAKVLQRRWNSSSDPAVKSAQNFFGAPTYQDVWVDVKEQLEKTLGNAQGAKKVVEDSIAIFDLFFDLHLQLLTRSQKMEK